MMGHREIHRDSRRSLKRCERETRNPCGFSLHWLSPDYLLRTQKGAQ